jgi:hypothetical protein
MTVFDRALFVGARSVDSRKSWIEWISSDMNPPECAIAGFLRLWFLKFYYRLPDPERWFRMTA